MNPASSSLSNGFLPPPRLHWGWILILGVITADFFWAAWLIGQANWARKVRGKSTAFVVGIANCCTLPALLFLAPAIWLTATKPAANESHYVTVRELSAMGMNAYSGTWRVAGVIAPGSVLRSGANANFVLLEQGNSIRVVYQGTPPPPDSLKEGAHISVVGALGTDNVFHATGLEAKSDDSSAKATAIGIAPTIALLVLYACVPGLWIATVFALRGELIADPINMPLGGVMTFILGPVYFQYHLALWKSP
jgi:cytochrome c-type biogenesis protein CcmE